ncbi:MAG TPA: undecaprenyl-diphosphate phosphatase, partial [Solirubrobacteraceae bacterium]|nr:undecaprenyl-diphosphate phosphatase [Solirubrobacteraceae bacterium]
YSFLLSIPAVTGAAILKVPDLLAGDYGDFTLAQTAVGIVAAAASGFFAIRYLLRLVATDDLTGFARYLVFAAVLVAIGYTWIGAPSSGTCV